MLFFIYTVIYILLIILMIKEETIPPVIIMKVPVLVDFVDLWVYIISDTLKIT